MSHFSWQLATCFQERVFLSAEQLSLRCSPRTHGQEDGAGDAVRLVSLICHLSCPLVPPLCQVPTTVAARMSFQAKHIHVLAAGLLSCKQMLARACSAHAHSWLWRACCMESQPWGAGLKGSALQRGERIS